MTLGLAAATTAHAFPTPLDRYPPPAADGLIATLGDRFHADPWNGIATLIFVLAILHTFLAARFVKIAHGIQDRHDERARSEKRPAGFKKDLRALAERPAVPDPETPEPSDAPGADGDDPSPRTLLPMPAWITAVHVAFMAWTVFNAHSPVLFLGAFLFFLGFVRATSHYQSEVELKGPLMVGFFLAGLVIHGGLQGWWIAPVLASLSEMPLFFGAILLTAFNDNALITYLATLVPNLPQALQIAVVQGAVTGGGLTVIANAPNPAGQALLGKFFGDGISPLKLLLAALLPTLIATLVFRLF